MTDYRTAVDLVSERWDRRLENWALWILGGQSSGVGSAYDGEWGGEGPRRPVPLVGEAVDTDELVARLIDGTVIGAQQHEAVRAWYVWTGSVQQKAADLRINRDTLGDRVLAAKWRLEDLWQARRTSLRRFAEAANKTMHGPAKCGAIG